MRIPHWRTDAEPAFLDAAAHFRRRAGTAAALLAAGLAVATVDSMLPEEEVKIPTSRAVAAPEPPAPRAVDGGRPLFLEPPPPEPAPGPGPAQARPVATTTGIPVTVLSAYQRAATLADVRCGLTWPVLAGIGRVESHHARGGDVTLDGTMRNPIYGPALDGTGGNAAIRRGAEWDRAAGPMQFISSTWAAWGADGSLDGRADVQNVYDAALAAGRYLCAGGTDMSAEPGLRSALLRYNHSNSYVDTVMGWIRAYRGGGFGIPDGSGGLTGISAGGEASTTPALSPPPPPPPQESGPAQPPEPEPEPQRPAPGEEPAPAPECLGDPVAEGRPCLLGGVATGLGEVVTGLGDAVTGLLPPLPSTPPAIPGITPPPS